MRQSGETAKPLPVYICHKRVWALKIRSIEILEDGAGLITPEEDGYTPFGVSREYMAKHLPKLGGYWVKYDDGYQSWSPAKAFEEGYTPDKTVVTQ